MNDNDFRITLFSKISLISDEFFWLTDKKLELCFMEGTFSVT